MGLNLVLLTMLGWLVTDDQPVLDRRLLQDGAEARAEKGRRRRWREQAHAMCDAWRGRANRVQQDELWVHGACGIRLPWRVSRSGMTQGTWGVQGMLMGTALPSCGARGDLVLFAAFVRFGASRAAKIALLRVPSFDQKSFEHRGSSARLVTCC